MWTLYLAQGCTVFAVHHQVIEGLQASGKSEVLETVRVTLQYNCLRQLLCLFQALQTWMGIYSQEYSQTDWNCVYSTQLERSTYNNIRKSYNLTPAPVFMAFSTLCLGILIDLALSISLSKRGLNWTSAPDSKFKKKTLECTLLVLSTLFYQTNLISTSVSRQDELNPALWLATWVGKTKLYYMVTIVRVLWLAAERELFSCNDQALWNFSSAWWLFWVVSKTTCEWAKTTEKMDKVQLYFQ